MTESIIKIGAREVRVHPAADLFPMMADAELDELAADIAKNGLQHGLVFWTPDDKQYGAGPPVENTCSTAETGFWRSNGPSAIRGNAKPR
jgi:hypothetical protein